MKILELRVLRGPNRWSGYWKKLIEMKLDLEEMEERPTDKIEGFAERLERIMPTLNGHECSEKRPGGFFERVRRGTWMGHVIEHIALEMQSLAGMDCGYGRTRSAGSKGVYYVVFTYELRSAGLYAARAAFRMANALINAEPFDLQGEVQHLRDIKAAEGYSTFSEALIRCSRSRNIPVQARAVNDLFVFGQGNKVKLIPLSAGHPLFPSLEIEQLFSDLSANGIPVNSEKTSGWQTLYRIFVLKGHALAAVEYQDNTPYVIYMDKIQVVNRIHPANIFLAERIARLTGLTCCTIEFCSHDITIPYNRNGGVVTDIVAGPPQGWPEAAETLIASSMIDDLFPGSETGRIPLVAITGTNGKTTTTRLIAHMARTAGHSVGFTNTDGIYINDQCINKGDCSGPSSAEIILRDPCVEFAVLECARGGIIRSGLGFDKCDVSVITNITGDHIGLDGINSNEALAKVKAVVAYATQDSGFAVLNTEDDLVYDLKKELDCNLALYGMQMNDRLKRHMHLGGLAAYVEDGDFIVCWHGCKSVVASVKDTPLTHQGRAECMIRNILPSLCVAMIRNFSIASIREALETFIPGPKFTPGRMNIFQLNQSDVMLDYAHNPDGFRELSRFLRNTEATKKIGIIGCPGDRLDSDLRSMGYMAAKMFDEIIIRHDTDGRGRNNEEITSLIMEGISGADRKIPVRVISDEVEALRYAITNAPEGSFIVSCTEDAETAIAFLNNVLATQPKLMDSAIG